jgi:hypothetical protein
MSGLMRALYKSMLSESAREMACRPGDGRPYRCDTTAAARSLRFGTVSPMLLPDIANGADGREREEERILHDAAVRAPLDMNAAVAWERGVGLWLESR